MKKTNEEPREEWKPVSGYEGRYEVSSFGRFRSFVKSGSQCHEKKCSMNQGYLMVKLAKSPTDSTTFIAHRLVAIAFIPNPEGKPTVNHKNGIKTDNRAENLEWATHKEQIDHSTATGLNKNRSGGPRLTRQQRADAKLLIEAGFTKTAIALKYGVTHLAITRLSQR